MTVGCGGSGGSGVLPTAPSSTSTPLPAAANKPNIVLVLLDDADYALTLESPRIHSLFADGGLSFNNAIATTPLCAPSRSNILTGRYAHNTGVYTNSGDGGGYLAWNAGGLDSNSLGPWLKAAGYKTGIFGKYVNDFPNGNREDFVAPGWDDWRVVLSDRVASNDDYTMNENGALRVYSTATGGYQTDVLINRTVDFIKAAESNDSQPFFAYLSISNPHAAAGPAPRHTSAYPGVRAPRTPSYDEADISDKPAWLRDQAGRLTGTEMNDIDVFYREQLQSMLSVDEGLDQLFRTLDQYGETANTYVFLTSDNGLFHGQHRLASGKQAVYEESIQMPFLVRGPNVAAGRKLDHVIGLLDLTPTFLALAGAAIPGSVDGVSLVPLLGATPPPLSSWRQDILVESFGAGAPFRIPPYAAVRTGTEVYVEYNDGDREYYDLQTDPYQLNNLVRGASSATLNRLAARLAALRNCRGASCRP